MIIPVIYVCLSGGRPAIVEVNNPCSSGRYVGTAPKDIF